MNTSASDKLQAANLYLAEMRELLQGMQAHNKQLQEQLQATGHPTISE